MIIDNSDGSVASPDFLIKILIERRDCDIIIVRVPSFSSIFVFIDGRIG